MRLVREYEPANAICGPANAQRAPRRSSYSAALVHSSVGLGSLLEVADAWCRSPDGRAVVGRVARSIYVLFAQVAEARRTL